MLRKTSITFIVLALLSSVTHAAPPAGECAVTKAIDSPAATFIKLPLIITNPAFAFVFAATSYRQAQCPQPELITREEARRLIDEAVAQTFRGLDEQHARCSGDGCPKTMTAEAE